MADESGIFNYTMDEDSSFSSSISPEPDCQQMENESPNAKDWAKILCKSDEYENKNLFINDNIHGHIKIPPICRAVIDTPQFDRLRGIRQLGNAHYVYPCAKHSRWEHSVGVMHLAAEFITALRHPDRGQGDCCDNKDQLCVMLAGLCHDLGHGPFSHLWENFVAEARPGYNWSHEQTSIEMFDYLIQENNLMPVFEEHGFTQQDIFFIKELIYGPLGHNGTYLGRGPDKHFLYEIVANKISSIDVDKWDYFLRDNRAMNLGLTFDYKRFILMSSLKDHGGKRRLALAEKEANSVKKLFEDRARLHDLGYQHRVIKKIDRMVLDMLLLADKHTDICYNKQGERVPLSSACDDLYVYCQLTDDYLYNSIRNSRTLDLQPARDIIDRISRRRLYKIIGSVRSRSLNISDRLVELQQSLTERVEQEGVLLSGPDLVLAVKRITAGLGRENPAEKVLFVDSRGSCRNYSATSLNEKMNFQQETLLVILRREGRQERREALDLVSPWASEHFDSDQYEFIDTMRD